MVCGVVHGAWVRRRLAHTLVGDVGVDQVGGHVVAEGIADVEVVQPGVRPFGRRGTRANVHF